MNRLGHLFVAALLLGVSDRVLRQDMRAMIEDRLTGLGGAGVGARLAFWAREIAGLAVFIVARPFRGRDASTEALLSLLPGHVGVPPTEPQGRARTRADRQLARYDALRELPWPDRWSIWSRAWPSIAADRSVKVLRWLPLVAVSVAPFVMLAVSLPRLEALAGDGLRGVAVVLVVLPALIGASVFIAGATVAMVSAPFLRRRINEYLSATAAGGAATRRPSQCV